MQFRYILPFISPRLDPTDIAGIQVFRNTLVGSENTEVSFEWNHEWQSGFATLGFFYLDKDFKEEIIQNGQEVVRHLSGDVKGLEIEYNQLLIDQVGVFGGYRYLKVDDEVDPRQDPRPGGHLIADADVVVAQSIGPHLHPGTGLRIR